jgi:chromosome segregation ATPase
MTTRTDDIATLQLRVLERIQAELVRLNDKSDETNRRLDETNKRLDETNKRLDETNERLETGLGSVRREMHEGFTRLRTAVIGLRNDVDDGLTGVKEEMNVGFTALRQQNDRRFLDHERRLRAIEKQLARRH